MSLIKSISGIRGTIGGTAGDNLTPVDIVSLVSAFVEVRKHQHLGTNTIVVGRDARLSGEIISQLVCSVCRSLGVDVVNIGLASTPTTELATIAERAMGGIIITASHNPMQWNALKLLNEKGEFIDKTEGEEVLQTSSTKAIPYASIDHLGSEIQKNYTDYHIDKILKLPLVDTEVIRSRHLSVALDAINSVGGIVVPELLQRLGIAEIYKLNCEPTGIFAHNPEPLPTHLRDLSDMVKTNKVDVGFAVDPDVDRLAIVCENGAFFGEEYTLVSVSDYVLSTQKGATVSNLSSTRALRDVSEKHGVPYFASAVGEVNVVKKMKATNAIIGGEGNGGIIYPQCHYGRDALVGIALFLSHLAKSNQKTSQLRQIYPNYSICKKKMELTENTSFDTIIGELKETYRNENYSEEDGLRIDFSDSWVHVRKSNTEPIIRIYAEAANEEKAEQIAEQIINRIKIL